MSICFTLTNIDWSLTKDVFSIIGTIGALTLGVVGLTTWKRQLKGTSEYQLAKKAILLTYEVQQLIHDVRNPALYLNKEEVESGRKIEEELRIYNERMQALNFKWAKLQTIRLESKVIWSDEAHDSFNEIQKRISELSGAIWLHFWMKGAYAGPGATVDNSPERVKENNIIVYFSSDDDKFTIKVKNSVEEIESFFINKVRT